MWNEQGPPTSLEGFWAASQAECAGRGDEWHAAIPCEEQRNQAFVDTPGSVPAPYVSLCSDTCLRSGALQCKQRDALPQVGFSPNVSGAGAPAAAMLPQVEPPWWEPLEEFQGEQIPEGGVQEQEVGTPRQQDSAPVQQQPAVERLAKERYTHAVPAGVPCGHAILLAGMPRAGRTLQAQLVMKALQYLGVPVAPAPSAYWNLPRQLNQSREEAAALYAEEDNFWLHNTTKDSVLVYQLHGFDAEVSSSEYEE